MNIPEISLYNKLYNDEDTTSINIDEFFEGCEECKTTNSLKRYVSKIAKYYDDLKNCLNSDSNEKCCRFFQYWLYMERTLSLPLHANNYKVWNNIISHVNNKLTKDISASKCNINHEKYPYAIINVRKSLDEFCSIMNFLGKSEQINSDRNKCLFVNEKINKLTNDILLSIMSIENYKNLEKEYFKISPTCTFLTFKSIIPYSSCPEEREILHVDSKTCENAPPETPSFVQPNDPPEALPVAPPQIVFVNTCTEQNTECAQDGIPVYHISLSAFITFLGTVFLFYLMYNVK
ncbi:hypothetical protein PVMG_04879 [Plasmodium vivax Mauritania I]|uniref:PIR Superfamily Protein n=1 Tax=Plasmodium vivax Mauritania I TaxID=1035515 RepID=A0A0J9T8Y7_PLAVI|nr:hypothetical protein PVMG_04879 [Plasmodium vivax Mauritania I]